MINIVIKRQKNSDKICLIEVKGHADSAPKGKDLVCAAVSAIIVGGFNAIENKKNFEMEIEEGYAKIIAIAEVSNYDSVVLKTIECQLLTVSEAHPDYVKIAKD